MICESWSPGVRVHARACFSLDCMHAPQLASGEMAYLNCLSFYVCVCVLVMSPHFVHLLDRLPKENGERTYNVRPHERDHPSLWKTKNSAAAVFDLLLPIILLFLLWFLYILCVLGPPPPNHHLYPPPTRHTHTHTQRKAHECSIACSIV
jgi:hypothetical protein